MVIVSITPDAFEQMERLPKPIRARMHGLITRLEAWPDVSGSKPLTGELAGRHRMRTGDYRLQFRVERREPSEAQPADFLIVIERVGHRKDVYDA